MLNGQKKEENKLIKLIKKVAWVIKKGAWIQRKYEIKN